MYFFFVRKIQDMSHSHDFMGMTGPQKIDICNWTLS